MNVADHLLPLLLLFCVAVGPSACRQGFTGASEPTRPAEPVPTPLSSPAPAAASAPEIGSIAANLGAEKSAATTVHGTLSYADHVATDVATGDTVFVMAREVATQKIVAVTRLIAAEPAGWPMHFVLADERLHLGAKVQLSARLDKDGNATTKVAGDLLGEAVHYVTLPAPAVELILSYRLEATPAAAASPAAPTLPAR